MGGFWEGDEYSAIAASRVLGFHGWDQDLLGEINGVWRQREDPGRVVNKGGFQERWKRIVVCACLGLDV